MSILLIAVATIAQAGEVVLDPRVTEIAVFKPGLVFVQREASVPAGLHQFRLNSVPQALDGTLWVDSPDGAKVSELRTTIDMRAPAGKRASTTIPDLLATSIGRTIIVQIRNAALKTSVETIKGKLLNFDGQNTATLQLPNGHLRSFSVYEAFDIGTEDLPKETTRYRPRVDLRFRIDATGPSHVRISSLELGAAWVANYRLKLNGENGRLESAAQLGLGSLSLSGAHVRLVTGVPNLDSKAKLDLATGSSSLLNYLNNSPGRLSQESRDPFEVAEKFLSQPNGQYAGGGGGLAGGAGLVGQSIDFISYDPSDNSLVVRNGDDAPAFLARAIQASRLEDLHIYDFNRVSLQAGGRITRVLSSHDVPLHTLYRWNVGPNTEFERVLRLHNGDKAGWPSGMVFLQSDGIPLAQVPMPFTAPGQDANLVLGTAEDLLHHVEVHEISRLPANPRTPNWVEVLSDTTIDVTNTRTEPVEMELSESITGEVEDSADASVKKVATSDVLNASSILTWRLDLAPGQKKSWVVKYRTVMR
ncbi:MAG: hypothetical protein P4L46_12185 [Fimbriimonas sp.]|nr:hypothetical protein [Fimbriimonas sp.]